MYFYCVYVLLSECIILGVNIYELHTIRANRKLLVSN